MILHLIRIKPVLQFDPGINVQFSFLIFLEKYVYKYQQNSDTDLWGLTAILKSKTHHQCPIHWLWCLLPGHSVLHFYHTDSSVNKSYGNSEKLKKKMATQQFSQSEIPRRIHSLGSAPIHDDGNMPRNKMIILHPVSVMLIFTFK